MPFIPSCSRYDYVNSLAIVTSSICEPLAMVTSHWSIILTLYLWTLSSPQWHCQPRRFSMAAHRHDRRGIYRGVFLRFHGRIEIDHSYGLCCHGLCCHSRHSTRGAGRRGRLLAPLVLCRQWQHKPFQRRPYRDQFLYSTMICKLVDLIPALHQSDCRIPNWVSAKTVHSSSTNHGQTTARFRSFFR